MLRYDNSPQERKQIEFLRRVYVKAGGTGQILLTECFKRSSSKEERMLEAKKHFQYMGEECVEGH